MNTTREKGVHKLATKNKTSIDPWARLIGRANEEQIIVNGHLVTALLDTGSKVTHISEAFCQANDIQINPLDQLVEIKGTGGDNIKYLDYIETTLTLPLDPKPLKLKPSC